MIKLLNVDLSREKTSLQKINENTMRKCLGGAGLGTEILYREVNARVNALDPDNCLVFLPGLLTGTGAPGCNLYCVIAKSPLTNGFGEAGSQGFFGSELRRTGFFALVIRGRAEKPVYISISDETIEIFDATEIWGRDAFETEDIIKEKLKDPKTRVASIGPAGENLVLFACIMNDKGHAAGRMGLGAVMGSKRLKAVAVRGTNDILATNAEMFKEVCNQWRDLNLRSETARLISQFGTAGQIEMWHALGDVPIKNWTAATFPNIEKLSGQYVAKVAKVKPTSCYFCHLAHNRRIEIDVGPFKGEYEAEPEYECCASLGSNCMIDDIKAVIKANDLCNRYGLDVISTGGVIAFAMECYEKGLITKAETDGVELKFSDTDAMLTMIRKIARRDGFGNILADETKRAAERIGSMARDLAIQVKGMTVIMHDPRAGQTRGLGDAVACCNGDAIGSAPLEWGGIDPELGVKEPLDRFSVTGKAEIFIKGQAKWVFLDSIGACLFATANVPLSLMANAVLAFTGWTIGLDEVFRIGDRVINIRRAMNIRSGHKLSQDTLPKRFLKEPKAEGGARGVTVNLRPMLEEYYKLRGWNKKTGKPSKEKLDDLDLEYVAKDLYE